MTIDKDRKRIIRKRMTITGEAYTTARRHVLAKAGVPAGRRTTSPPAAPPVDPKLAGQTDETMRTQTGHSWAEWVRLLDAAGAATMTHTQIARLVQKDHRVPGWWSQAVTVGYERLKGRRDVGQRANGAFEAGKSKTFTAPVATVFEAWADDHTRARWLDGIETTIRTATRPKSLRLQWPDGTIVAAWFERKSPDRCVVSVAHTKLPSRAVMEKMKTEWGRRLDALSQLLAHDER
jgi:hypothetical protein